MDPNWEDQLDEMNRSKRGRPFTCPDLLMGSIVYLRWIIGNGVRGPDPVTIWRRTCAQTASIKIDHITVRYDSRRMVEIAISPFKKLWR